MGHWSVCVQLIILLLTVVVGSASLSGGGELAEAANGSWFRCLFCGRGCGCGCGCERGRGRGIQLNVKSTKVQRVCRILLGIIFNVFDHISQLFVVVDIGNGAQVAVLIKGLILPKHFLTKLLLHLVAKPLKVGSVRFQISGQ